MFSSSAAVYGTPDVPLVTEDLPKRPASPYGESKLIGEWLLRDQAVATAESAHPLRHTSLRYFNVVGSADPSVYDTSPHNLFPLVFEALLDGRTPRINGDDYDTHDGTCVRDYVHVSDLADAHVLALRSLERDAGFAAYNLGTGRGFSIREIIDAASRRLGRTVEVSVGPRRPGDLDATTAVAALAARELGWTPRLSNLDDIIDTAWRWRLRRLNRAAQGVEPVS